VLGLSLYPTSTWLPDVYLAIIELLSLSEIN